MGSFNTTCMASGQTIATDDACVVLPIVRQKTYAPAEAHYRGQVSAQFGATPSIAHPNAFWRACGGFIEAEYDDYGQFELRNTPNNLVQVYSFLATLYERAPVVAQGENEYHDLPFDLPAFVQAQAPLLHRRLALAEKPTEPDNDALFIELEQAWAYVWKVAFKQRLFLADRGKAMHPVQFAVMHRASFDYLTKLTAQGATWDGRPMGLRNTFDTLVDALKGALPRNKTRDTEFFTAVMEFSSEFRTVGGYEGALGTAERDLLRESVTRYVGGELDADALFAKLEPLLAARYALAGLELLNIPISPMMYAGQDYDNSIGRAYAKFVRQISTEVTRQRRRHDA